MGPDPLALSNYTGGALVLSDQAPCRKKVREIPLNHHIH